MRRAGLAALAGVLAAAGRGEVLPPTEEMEVAIRQEMKALAPPVIELEELAQGYGRPGGLSKRRRAQELVAEVQARTLELAELAASYRRVKSLDQLNRTTSVVSSILRNEGRRDIDRALETGYRQEDFGREVGGFVSRARKAVLAEAEARRTAKLRRDEAAMEKAAWAGAAAAALILALAWRRRGKLAPSPSAPSLAGRWTLGAAAGAGSLGELLAARSGEGREALARRLRPELTRSERDLAALLEAARRLSSLEHPRLARVLEVLVDGPQPWILTERAEGEGLGEALARRGAFPVGQAVPIVLQAAEALGHAHSLGMLHGDLGPGALVLGPRGAVKVVDFHLGLLAKRALARQGRLSAPAVLYWSPETEMGGGDARSDLFSLAAVLFALLAGRAPFPDGGLAQKTKGRPKVTLPDVTPARLSAVLFAALDPEPSRRPASVAEFADALKGL